MRGRLCLVAGGECQRAVPIPIILHSFGDGAKGQTYRTGYCGAEEKGVGPYFLFNLRLMTASLRLSKELSVLAELDAPWNSARSS